MQSAKTKRDLRGGWMDAGDPNKYTFYAGITLVKLLDGYRKAPWAYDGNVNIPESNNNLADLLDEAKWALEFLKRMQNATGTNGLMSRVGLFRGNLDASRKQAKNLGEDKNPRYCVGECPYATISGAAAFAAAGNAYLQAPEHLFFANDLIDRAKRAWDRYKPNASLDPVYDLTCDSGGIVLNSQPGLDVGSHKRLAIVAAVYLYEALISDPVNAPVFKAYVENNYAEVINSNSFFVDFGNEAALVHYSNLNGVTPSVKDAIQLNKRLRATTGRPADQMPPADHPAQYDDLFRSPISDGYYSHAGAGYHIAFATSLLDIVYVSPSTSLLKSSGEIAAEHAHWLHGSNPLSVATITGMETHLGAAAPLGAKSVPDIYHHWLGGLSDNKCTSNASVDVCMPPPPAFVVAGPCSPIYGNKVTGCFDGGAPQRNFSIAQRVWKSHEPSIWLQSRYVNLLGRLATGAETVSPAAPATLTRITTRPYAVKLSWKNSTDATAGYNVYVAAGADPSKLKLTNVRTVGTAISTNATVEGPACNTTYTFSVEAVDQVPVTCRLPKRPARA